MYYVNNICSVFSYLLLIISNTCDLTNFSMFVRFSCRLCRRTSRYSAHRTSVPEPDASQEEKAPNVVHAQSDIAARGKVQQTQIPVFRGSSGSGQSAKDDRRAGQNVVSKPTHQMEVMYY